MFDAYKRVLVIYVQLVKHNYKKKVHEPTTWCKNSLFWLVFRNAIDFYILISRPATFLFTCYYLPITLFSSCLTALLRYIEYISFMCKTLYFSFCIHYSVCTTKNLVFTHQHAVDPFYPFCPPPPFPTGKNYSVLYIYVLVSVWFGYLFIYFWLVFFL